MILLDRCTTNHVTPNEPISHRLIQFIMNAVRQEIRTEIEIIGKNLLFNRSDRFI